MPEVDKLIKLAVAKAIVVARSYAKKTANGCCVVQLVGGIRCATLIITPFSLASATFLTGFQKILLEMVCICLNFFSQQHINKLL